MRLALLRYGEGDDSTLGLLFVDEGFACYTLEDEARAVKVPGETRIPNGMYQIQFREVMTPLTQRYRDRFPWFTWHLELQHVVGFTNVYLHIGNDDDDTDACILVGDEANNNLINSGWIGRSAQAYERIYRKISAALTAGEQVFIDIRQANMFLVARPTEGERHG